MDGWELGKLDELLKVMKGPSDATEVNSKELYEELLKTLGLAKPRGKENKEYLFEIVTLTFDKIIENTRNDKSLKADDECLNKIKTKFREELEKCLRNDGENKSSEPLLRLLRYVNCLVEFSRNLKGLGKDVCPNISEEDFKNIAEVLIRNIKSKLYLYDITTYSIINRTMALTKALKSTKEELKRLFCKFLLLAAATTYLKDVDKLSPKSLWFYEFVRAALSTDKFKFDSGLWLENAAILVYAYTLECSADLKRHRNISIKDIVEIVRKLLSKS